MRSNLFSQNLFAQNPALKPMLKPVLKLGQGFALLLCSFSALATPQIQTWQTENGVKVLFVPATEIPMLDVRIVFDAGSARDDGLSGLATLTNGLLSEGAAGKTSQQIAEAFESVGANIGYGATRDSAFVGVRSLTESRYLSVAVESLKQVLTQPDFPQGAFQRELRHMKISVKARQQSPAALAGEAFNKAVFGDHPYASPSVGTKESLQKITLENVSAFYKKYYVASNATVAIVGNVERWQAEEIVKAIVSALPIGEKPAALPEVKQLTEAKKIVIDYPSSQTHIFVGQPGIKRGDEDYFTLYVANHPFGGNGFTSRLVDVIREENGLAYSVYSYFSPMRELGAFTMGMQTKTEQTEQALSLLNAQLKKYVEQGPEEKELAASMSNITGGFPLNIDSNSKLLGYLGMIGFYDLPIDYLDKFIANIKAVDASMINDALKRRVHLDKMVTVIVGKQQESTE
ncbi:FIG015287: Zinc protease [hydrothermal vent metagenome]|uniref:FIG015287: Zinc protease n=1 Tax=hydrothermal vent metagenome TaxID=652676 RepID=A0A3B0WLB3_9ZZZZ